MLVTDFSDKKVVDYLNTGKYKKVLLIMNHGLGDAFMFYSMCYKTLIEKYPDISFSFDTHLGQEDLFGHVDKNPDNYDIAFKFIFPCSEWDDTTYTKGEKCAHVEIGLDDVIEDFSTPVSFRSPLVGIHLNSTCMPSMNVPEDFAEKLWNQIIEADLIPIDTHMRHYFDNKNSVVHEFEQCRRVDNIPATLPKLMGLLSSCSGFAGVASGNFFCALNTFPPEKILFLGSAFRVNKLTKLPVHELNCKGKYNPDIVAQWLKCVKEQ